MNQEGLMQRSIRQTVLKGFGLFFLLVFAVAGSSAVYKGWNENRSQSQKEALQRAAVRLAPEASFRQTEGKPAVPVTADFARLRAENPELAAWLYVPALSLSYPVMYSGDNRYYLHRSVSGVYAFEGTPFLDAACGPDFTSANTIIYGHNMRSGRVFGSLWKIPYQAADLSDPAVWIATPERTLHYRIFSAFAEDVHSDGFDIPECGSPEFLDWAGRMQNASFLPADRVRFRENDRVVTLTTCAKTAKERVFVMARLEEVFEHKGAGLSVSFGGLAEHSEEEPVWYRAMLQDVLFYRIAAVFLSGAAVIGIFCLRRRCPKKTGIDIEQE